MTETVQGRDNEIYLPLKSHKKSYALDQIVTFLMALSDP